MFAYVFQLFLDVTRFLSVSVCIDYSMKMGGVVNRNMFYSNLQMTVTQAISQRVSGELWSYPGESISM